MSDSQSASANKAVFLSYASQDAEAVERIAVALRTAGVDVWFDKSELTGGDAWDAKIRKQIAECGLFVPVISANTQARDEGYFRLEWKLAVDRSHLMAHDKPFLLPVVIDVTSDAAARVLPEFRAVQWTRLPGGDTSPAFCSRVRKLLGGEVAPVGPVADHSPYQESDQPSKVRWSRSWLVPALVAGAAAVVALALWQPWKKPTPADAPPAAPSTAPLSEARKLVTQARALFEEGDPANHENFSLAEDLLKRAETLDSFDGEVWAAHAELSADTWTMGYDRSSTRRGNWRTQAERAKKLAPNSIEAQVAYAGYLTWGGENSAKEAVRLLNHLGEIAPTHHRLFRTLGFAEASAGYPELGLAAFDRSDSISGGDPSAVVSKNTLLFWTGRYEEAMRPQSEAVRITGRGQMMEVLAKLVWYGDLDGAAAAVERWPAWLLLEQRGAFFASQVWLWRREPEKAITVLAAVPQDFFSDTFFIGPKAGLLALAHEMAGHTEAARNEWQIAKKVTAQVSADDPAIRRALAWKACALARLGETAEAEAIFRDLQQTHDLFSEFWSCGAPSALLRIALGHEAEVPTKFDTERRSTWINSGGPSPSAALRLNPVFDSIRATPQFQKWMAAAPGPEQKPSAVSVSLDDKAVAVLPFKNLSGDKDQEYFSDGLTEEILNGLARERDLRVPGVTSSFSFKGKNASAAEIAKALNVSRLVEGSVQRSGTKVRIRVSLTRVADNASEELGTFTEELSDIFALQDKVARAVVEKLTHRQLARNVEVLTNNTDAYNAYLKGRAQQTRSIGGATASATFYEQAVAIDPGFALAWARLAEARFRRFVAQSDRSPEVISSTKTAIDRALAVQPDLPEALIARATWAHQVDCDFAAARRDLDRAEALQPATAELRMAQFRHLRSSGGWI